MACFVSASFALLTSACLLSTGPPHLSTVDSPIVAMFAAPRSFDLFLPLCSLRPLLSCFTHASASFTGDFETGFEVFLLLPRLRQRVFDRSSPLPAFCFKAFVLDSDPGVISKRYCASLLHLRRWLRTQSVPEPPTSPAGGPPSGSPAVRAYGFFFAGYWWLPARSPPVLPLSAPTPCT